MFDVILMDMNMPEKDGLAATREIRAYESEHQLEPTPILALTAYAFAEQAQACREAGCDEHLSKPIAKQDLLAALARHGRRSLAVAPDHDMADLADDYLDQRVADLSAIHEALEANDFESIRVRGHNMKGTGRGYGFPIVSAVGGAIEAAAKSSDGEAVRSAAAHLTAFVARAGEGRLERKPDAVQA